MRITLQPAYVLHQRPYRETSLLLDIFTQDYGRVSLVARGVKKGRSRLGALLQPFSPLLISWQGKGELCTLISAESHGLPIRLLGACLLSGLYLNELLVRLLQNQDPHPMLYTIYQHTLLELRSGQLQEKTLRFFELKLLAEIGYGLRLQPDLFLVDQLYRFIPEQGFECCAEGTAQAGGYVIFSGKMLRAFAAEQLENADDLKEAKRLMRLVFGALLGQPLHSRKLFMEIGIDEST